MEQFAIETVEMAAKRKSEIAEQFEAEVVRLLQSGGIDPASHNRAMLFGVALENISDNYLRGDRKTKDYKNIKCF